MQYFLLLFLFFVGHGAAFSSMSPLILGQFGENSHLIFFAGQLAFPFGYFGAGILSDRLRRVKSLLCISLALHALAQHMLFSATAVPEAMVFSGLHRFFVGVNTQLTMIAALEGRGTGGFARVRTGGTAGFFLVHGALFILQGIFENAARSHGQLFGSLAAQRFAGERWAPSFS
ncbi:MAG: hypothetical protein HY042_04980 [Spirochaetia bacterium]|nr:hypothetical protein [Spirochaetia bacterium]